MLWHEAPELTRLSLEVATVTAVVFQTREAGGQTATPQA